MQFTKQQLIDSLAQEGLPLEQGNNEQLVSQEQQIPQQQNQPMPQQESSGIGSYLPENLAYQGLKQLGHGAANVTQGILRGVQDVHNLPYEIVKQISPETARDMEAHKGFLGRVAGPDTNTYDIPGASNPGAIGRFAQQAAEFVPGATIGSALAASLGPLTGGALVAHPLAHAAMGGMMGGAATGGSEPFLGGALGTLTGLGMGVLPGAIKGIAARPGMALKDLIKQTSKPYMEENILGPGRAMYENLYKDAGNKALNVKKLLKDIPFEDFTNTLKESGLKKPLNAILENPNYKNTHKLLSDVGKELNGLYKTLREQHSLPGKDRVRLEELKTVKEALTPRLDELAHNISPKFAKQHVKASEFHRDVTVPARNLTDVVKTHVGKLNNTVDKKALAADLKNAGSIGSQENLPFSHEGLTLSDRLIRGIPAYRNLGIGAGLIGARMSVPSLSKYLSNLFAQHELTQPMLEK